MARSLRGVNTVPVRYDTMALAALWVTKAWVVGSMLASSASLPSCADRHGLRLKVWAAFRLKVQALAGLKVLVRKAWMSFIWSWPLLAPPPGAELARRLGQLAGASVWILWPRGRGND